MEVKSFLEGTSAISEFHTALGQFLNYRFALSEDAPDRILYLAIPISAYENFFTLRLPQHMIQSHRIKFVVYDPDKEIITQWQN